MMDAPKEITFTPFVRKPFRVEAVQITDENIYDIAEYVGTVQTRGDDGSQYILVDKRRIPNVEKVYPGFWVTRMDQNYRCYSERVFAHQFIQETPPQD